MDEHLRQRYLQDMGIESWSLKPSPYAIFLATDTQGDLALVAAITTSSADLQRQLWQKISAVFREVPGRMIETSYSDIPRHCHTASRVIVLGDFMTTDHFNHSNIIMTNSLADMIQNPSLKAPVWHAITRTFSPNK